MKQNKNLPMDRKSAKASSSGNSSAATSSSKSSKRLQSSSGILSRPVNAATATEKVWLVKVPKYLAQQWLSPQYDNEAVIARLTRAVDAQGKSRFRLKPVPSASKARAAPIKRDPSSSRLSTAGSTVMSTQSGAASSSSTSMSDGVEVFDREYEFLINPMKERDHSMVILCEGAPPTSSTVAPQTEPGNSKPSAQLLGMVSARVDCRTCQVDQSYIRRLKEGFASANKPKGEIKIIDQVKPTFMPVSDHEHNIRDREKKKNQGKNIRRDVDDVRSDLFRAFERHQYYKFNDLVEITKQPPPHLRSILEDIADYNVKPPYKNMWELKPQYRHYISQEPSGPS